MLYKFKSRATADVIMLEPNGRQLVQIMGKGARRRASSRWRRSRGHRGHRGAIAAEERALAEAAQEHGAMVPVDPEPVVSPAPAPRRC